MTDTRAALAAVAAEVNRLRSAYIERLAAELPELQTMADSLTGAESDRAVLSEIHHRLHKLAGSGGTFGLSSLSTHARNLERTVKSWLDGDVTQVSMPARLGFSAGIAALPVTLADVEQMVVPAVAEVTEEVAAENASKRIWLVEDDEFLGREFRQMLEQFGYDVRLFLRLADVMAALEQEAPDVMVMDVLFQAEGLNATQVLLESATFRDKRCPLIFMSAAGDFESRVRAARLGAEAYLLKPFDVSQLVEKLDYVLGKRSQPPFRILIVDDDTALNNHYRLVLSAAGMDVDTLDNPPQLIEHLSAFRPELVLMDLNMPGYSGQELATVVRHHDDWIGLPIVYLSAETDLDRQLEAMGFGADDFLSKPISDAQLVAAVTVRAERARQLANLMYRDSLTGLLTHARIKEALSTELQRAGRLARPLSVVMLDIDHFKSINDTYGHPAGDRIIKAISHLLRQRLRRYDEIGRYGGEEFCAVLSGCEEAVALAIMDDVRQRFAALRFHHAGAEFACTLSAGIATARAGESASTAELIQMADNALYVAKHGGRNQVRCYSREQDAGHDNA